MLFNINDIVITSAKYNESIWKLHSVVITITFKIYLNLIKN